MYTIIDKTPLSHNVSRMEILAPPVARKALPGQFVILRLDETGERFPLTLCDWSAAEGWIRLVLQVVGRSTRKLSLMEAGEGILDLVGPLGRPAEICAGEHVVCVGGGVGIAAIHPICRALREAGNRVTGIIGARTDDLLILEEEMTAVIGIGPVNALDLALRKALMVFYPSIKEMRLTDYKVRVLESNSTTAAKVRVLIETTDEKSTWTTVGVSNDIIEASLIALVDSIEYKLLK